jgi:geranylgeranyl pyrophosphate synthase
MASEIVMDASLVAAQSRFSDALGWRAVEPRWKEAHKSGDVYRLRQSILSQKGGYHRMAAPLEAGLRLGGASEQLISIAKRWGAHAGVALEGLDHLNVLTSNPLETGKDSLQDIRAGRLVLPLFLIREHTSPSEWEEIENILEKSDSKFTCNPAVR